MQLSSNHTLFISIAALGIIAFLACWDAYRAHKKADDAQYGEKGSRRAHIRLDRMQSASKFTDRETVAVSYSKGFQLRDSWEDDFHRTQLIRQTLKPPWYNRLIRWLLY